MHFYKNKTVLVTGHTGFKGAWLCQWLTQLGANVIGYALPPENQQNNLYNDLALSQKINSVIGDINNYQQITEVVAQHKPEIVFHLAAQSLVRKSYRDPRDTFATNVMGTVNLLEVLRNSSSIKAFINVTTDKCYENKEWLWGYREVDRLGGRDPYSASKACAELVTHAYRQSFLNNTNSAKLASVRAGNVIGGGDWSEDRLVPDIVCAIKDNKPIIIRSPNALRPWQHVLDVLHGYLLLGKSLLTEGKTFADAWNFGPNDTGILSVIDLTQAFIKSWGTGEVIIEPDSTLHEATLLKLDSSKAKTLLGWKPLLTPSQTIDLTVDWYRSYLNNKNSIVALTQQQINQFMAIT